MRKALPALLALGALALPIADAAPVAPGVHSDNIEYITTVPFDAGLATGGRLLGDHFYVAGAKSFSIYDVSDPLAPALLSVTPTGFTFANEDVDTNGKILMISNDQPQTQKVQIFDVEDATAPKKLAELPARDHNFACVLGCKWAYGSRGTILDLRDPANPRQTGIWGVGVTPNDGFDTTEVAPGLVLAATRPLQLIDGWKDPAHPKIVARGDTRDMRLLHSVEWPRGARDRWALVQGETFAETRCDNDSGALMTWDTRGWRRTHSLTMKHEYRTENGTYVDGSPAASAFGCTAMWLDPHPDFHNGGLVAAAWFEHGVRFIDVRPNGTMAEDGYFMPLAGAAIAAYWRTKEIVYVVDSERGIDILRYNP